MKARNASIALAVLLATAIVLLAWRVSLYMLYMRGSLIEAPINPESKNLEETQRAGWQSILDNFKVHVERRGV